MFADNIDGNVLVFLRKSSQQTLLVIINTSFESTTKTIPLWNQNLDGAHFVDILNKDQTEYNVQNNWLYIPEIYPCWGRVLELRFIK